MTVPLSFFMKFSASYPQDFCDGSAAEKTDALDLWHPQGILPPDMNFRKTITYHTTNGRESKNFQPALRHLLLSGFGLGTPLQDVSSRDMKTPREIPGRMPF